VICGLGGRDGDATRGGKQKEVRCSSHFSAFDYTHQQIVLTVVGIGFGVLAHDFDPRCDAPHPNGTHHYHGNLADDVHSLLHFTLSSLGSQLSLKLTQFVLQFTEIISVFICPSVNHLDEEDAALDGVDAFVDFSSCHFHLPLSFLSDYSITQECGFVNTVFEKN
jgi:hypothetical protein